MVIEYFVKITVSQNYPKELFNIIYHKVLFSIGLLSTKILHAVPNTRGLICIYSVA